MSIESGIENSSSILLPPPGTIIADRFRIIDLVGRGGMGVVFRAEHINLQKEMAVKMLMGDFERDGANYKRFHTEARIASMLDHPNIVRVHDFGVLSNGVPYLSMDFLAGQSLEDDLKLNLTLTLDRFRMIFLQTCDALEHAHQEGVIHRDIKPSNIMLVTRNKQGDFVKIVDFGLVKVISMNGAEQKLTSTNTLVGSPLFMSPEQCRGLDLDLRSDIYSLGCVMYRALAGALPIAGETALDTLYKHVSEQPLPLSKVNPSLKIPPALEYSIMKALCKTPEARQQSMAELRAEIEDALPGGPVAMLRTSAHMPALSLPQDSTQVSNVSRLRDAPELTPPEGVKRKVQQEGAKWKVVAAVSVLLLGAGALGGAQYMTSHRVTPESQPVAVKPSEAPPAVASSVVPEPKPVAKEELKPSPVQTEPKVRPKPRPSTTPLKLSPHEQARIESARFEKEGTKKFEEGDFDAAQQMLEKALSIRDNDDKFGPTSPYSMPTLAKLIQVCMEKKDPIVKRYFFRFCECWTAHPNNGMRGRHDVMTDVTDVAIRLSHDCYDRKEGADGDTYFAWAMTFAGDDPELLDMVAKRCPLAFFRWQQEKKAKAMMDLNAASAVTAPTSLRGRSHRARRFFNGDGAILLPKKQ